MSAGSTKPRLRMVDGQIVSVRVKETPIEAARRRFGQPFAHQTGSTWKPRAVPLLVEWMQSRGRS